MKILASKREYPTLQDYVESGLFNKEQLEELMYAFGSNLSPKKVLMLADPKFDAYQMSFLRRALIDYPVSKVAPYADPCFNIDQMRFWNIKYTQNVSDEIADLIESSKVSDRTKYNIIYSVVDLGVNVEDLRPYLASGCSVSFLEGISPWIGSAAGDIVLNLYKQYPEAFTDRQSDDIDGIASGVDVSSSHIQNQLTSCKWSSEQMSVLLDALYAVYFGDKSAVTLEMMLDPNLSADDMRHILWG